jgi:hypothetical protein
MQLVEGIVGLTLMSVDTARLHESIDCFSCLKRAERHRASTW